MKTLLRTVTASCVLAISFCPTLRADLVTNGGFEATPDHLAGWTIVGNSHDIFICGNGVGPTCDVTGFTLGGFPNSGNAALAVGAPQTPGGIEQTLTTVPGDAYDISFWVANCAFFSSCDPNSLTLTFGDTTVFAGSDLSHSFYTEFTFNDIIATDASTILSITGQNDSSYFLLDDISVTPDPDSVAATPEPATLVTAGSGLVGILVAGLRRRKR